MSHSVEVDCPNDDCEGTLSLSYDVDEDEPEVGYFGAVEIGGIEDVHDCECGHHILPGGNVYKAFDNKVTGRWEDAAASDFESAGEREYDNMGGY